MKTFHNNTQCLKPSLAARAPAKGESQLWLTGRIVQANGVRRHRGRERPKPMPQGRCPPEPQLVLRAELRVTASGDRHASQGTLPELRLHGVLAPAPLLPPPSPARRVPDTPPQPPGGSPSRAARFVSPGLCSPRAFLADEMLQCSAAGHGTCPRDGAAACPRSATSQPRGRCEQGAAPSVGAEPKPAHPWFAN